MLDKLELPNETIDKIYDDVAHPVAAEAGTFLGRIGRAINAAFAPLDCWILTKENNIAKTKLLLENNLKNADPDKIVPPEPYVAVPALQALSYSMNSDELRELYANLLAKSIYLDTKDDVHPAYSEIIKNLSPLDCKVLETIMSQKTQEIGYYEFRVGQVGNTSYHVVTPYVTSLDFASVDHIATSVDNLSRCKLINALDFHYDDDKMYAPIRETEFYRAFTEAFSYHPNNQELRPYKMALRATRLGRAFYDTCCTPL